MSGIQQTLLGGSPAGYQIERSLRFNSADSAYLNRTPASASNRKTWTYNVWLKRSSLAAFQRFLSDSSNNSYLRFNTSDQLDWNFWNGTSYGIATSQVFRDVSAWYMITLAIDTTQATDTNRVKIYVNGSQITAFASASYPPQNAETNFNNNTIHYISGYGATAEFLNGYLTEINFIDGQALTPSDFGETDAATGVWKPKKYAGTYGTNGFYLNFSDSSNTTSATLGKDSSGNGNNWTPNLFSVTAGAGNDSLVDTPTSYGTDIGVGGEVRGNYCTWNPLAGTGSGVTGYGWTLANGNLDYTATDPATYSNTITSTFAVTSGKWYLEVTMGSSPAGGHPIIGVIETEDISLATSTSNFQTATYTSVVRGTDGQKSVFGSTSFASYGSSLASGDRLNIAIDGDNGKIWWGKNGTWFNSGVPASGTNAGDTFTAGRSLSIICTAYNANGTNVLNAGQRPFADTVPSGFKALCTQNLPTPTIGATSTTQANDYFNVATWTGNDATRTITGYGFQPDFIWTKGRNVAAGHRLSDAVRGASGGTMLNLNTASTGAENTDTAITGFASDGFTMDGSNHPNVSPYTYVGWGWKANGAGSSNTAGTITSTVSASTTSGFSIATFTMPASGTSDTVGHGLGVAPAMVIVKSRGSSSWGVYHKNLTSAAYYLRLQTTDGETSSNSYWNSTAPTSTVFTLGATWYGAGTMVAYSFAPIEGYSAFGSYSGNNSSTDGSFVYLGFRPRFIMIKSTSSGTEWVMVDSARSTYNLVDTSLYANQAYSESTIGTVNDIDFLSNGFKLRNNTGYVNASQTYIYAAFAENPFKYSLAR